MANLVNAMSPSVDRDCRCDLLLRNTDNPEDESERLCGGKATSQVVGAASDIRRWRCDAHRGMLTRAETGDIILVARIPDSTLTQASRTEELLLLVAALEERTGGLQATALKRVFIHPRRGLCVVWISARPSPKYRLPH